MPARKTTRTRPHTTQPRLATRTDVFAIGDVVAGTYEIRKVLGSGGMGQVFEAHDRDLNRRVALKAHWPHLAKVFPIGNEARALAAIRHPSVVSVHGLARHGDLEVMVMERIAGVTLADHMDRQRAPMPIAEAIDILARLADGLAAVHAAGIAHRDVKPGNVMLAPRNRLVLTDFGIFLPEFQRAERDVTPGTAEYMAPEAILQNVARGGAYLVDVYAFGVLAFELLCGRRPFHAPSVQEILLEQLRKAAPPVRSVRSDVPPRLAALVDGCLHKDPAERPATMESVGTALRAKDDLEERPLSVLVAEDDRALADVLEAFVADVVPAAEVRVARDGDAVLAHVRQSPPDLLLLDLGLPSMNGIELVMYLRGAGIAPDMRIVAISAGAQARDVALLRQLGIGTFIRKGSDWLDKVEQSVRTTRVSRTPRRAPV